MTKEQLINTHDRIAPLVHRTPILTSSFLNNLSEASLYFKCENFQRMGAFKMRGAAAAITNMIEEQRKRGVVTHSSGNFAQAVALSAKLLGVKAFIVMPENAPAVKKAAVKGYGGEITICDSTLEARQAAAEKIMTEHGATFVHPSNELEVILGNATSAMELLEEQVELDYIVTPVGGGGLIAGAALAANYFGKNCKAIAAEPANVDDAFRSLISGKIESNDNINTIADGLRTNLGDINFPIIQKYVDQIIRVEEQEILAAMRLIWERMKIVVEASSATTLAAVLKSKDLFVGKKVGLILSGGNVDLGKLSF